MNWIAALALALFLAVRAVRPRTAHARGTLRRAAGSTAAALVVATALTALAPAVGLLSTTPANAATACSLASLDGAGHPFYVNLPTQDSNYVGWNVTATANITNAWVQLSGFTSPLSLATNQPSTVHLGPMASGANLPAYFELMASATSTTAVGYTVTVYDGNPALGGTPVCSGTDSFTSVNGSTIAANSNKVTAITVAPAQPVVGGTFTITITGQTGTIGSGDTGTSVGWFNPDVISSWPAAAFQLTGTQLFFGTTSTTGTPTYVNRLVFTSADSTYAAGGNYAAVYSFAVRGSTSSNTATDPLAYIASGTQEKFTGSYPATIPPVAPPTDSTYLTKAVSLNQSTGVATFNVTATNTSATSAVSLDDSTDTPSAPTSSYVAGSATFAGAPIADPVVSGGSLIFEGPLTIPANSSVILSYQLHVPPGAGSNSVVGHVGTYVIGNALNSSTPATTSYGYGYQISYQANGGSNPPVDSSYYATGSSVTLSAGATMTPPVACTTLAGWDTSPTATTPTYAVSGGTVTPASFTITANTTLYAIWSGCASTITVTSTAPTTALVGGSGYTPTATSTSGDAVTITVDPTSSAVCSISGGVVHYTAAGTCTLDFNDAGNANYSAAPQVTQSFTVTPAPQPLVTITFTTPAPLGAHVGDTYTPTASSSSGLPVTIAVAPSSSGVCSISAGVVTFTASGTCLLDASQVGVASPAPQPATQSVGVTAQSQDVTATAPTPATARVGDTFTPTATATSGLPVTISVDSTSTAVCSISAGVVTFNAPGTCVLDFTQPGDIAWLPATQVQQTITVSSVPSGTPPGGTVGTGTGTQGVPVIQKGTTVTIGTATTGLRIQTNGTSVSFTKSVITLETGTAAHVSGYGFVPGSTVIITLGDAGIIGTVTVGVDGTYQATVQVPTHLADGHYHVTSSGTSATGPLSVAAPVVVVSRVLVPIAPFPFNGHQLTPTLARQVMRAARAIALGYVAHVTVYGYTDPVGSRSYNVALSRQRVLAVIAQLRRDLAALHAHLPRITITPRGKANLVVTGGHVNDAKSRRVIITLD